MSDHRESVARVEWRESLLLLLITVAAYGLLIPWLGYYYDDWCDVLFFHYGGPRGQIAAYAVDRPLIGWHRAFWSLILGQSPLPWHIFALIGRYLCTFAYLWMLRHIWPDRRLETLLMSLLFAVYPGTSMQAMARTFAPENISSSVAILLSYGLMMRSVTERRRARMLVGASLVMVMISLAQEEYYFGLEAFRPVLLFVLVRRVAADNTAAIKETLIRWLPWGAVVFAYAVIRIFFWPTRYMDAGGRIFTTLYYLKTEPLDQMRVLFERAYQYFANAIVLPLWTPLSLPSLTAWSAPVFGFWLVVLAVSGGLFLYLRARPDAAGDDGEQSPTTKAIAPWVGEAIVLGLAATILSVSHLWLVSYELDLGDTSNRFNRIAMFGFCVAAVSMFAILFPDRRRMRLVFSCLIGLSAGYHLVVSTQYVRNWEHQRDIVTQMAWRAPHIEPGTMVYLAWDDRYVNDSRVGRMSVSTAISLRYDAGGDGMRRIPYWVIRTRMHEMPIAHDTAFVDVYRATAFRGTTARSVVMDYAPPFCLRLVDPERLDDYPFLSNDARIIADRSRLDRIGPVERPVPPLIHDLFFAGADSDCWCHYIEQAERSRQFGDWDRVAALGDELRRKAVAIPAPENALELTVFLEGYAHAGRWDAAEQVARRIATRVPGKLAIRSVLARVERDIGDPAALSFGRRMRLSLGIEPAPSGPAPIAGK